MTYRIGVDIGGSFTDFVMLDEESREIRTLKVLSRPDQPGQEVIAGIGGLQERYGGDAANISYFTHGTTVGVNAVIQRKGLRLALFTTENFSDVLELGRLKLPGMYDLLSRRPAPLISRHGVRHRRADDCRRNHRDAVGESLHRDRPARGRGAAVQSIARTGV